MCMLCVIPPHVTPDRDMLINSALNNPHGFGFAIAVPDEQRIISERSMNADESINRFLEVRSQYQDGYATWHARYATHGSKVIENCHPFVVGNDLRTYLSHNGILDVDVPKGDDRSDTRIFAEELIPALGGVTALDNPWVFDMLEDYTSGSKVAILTVDPKAKHELYLLNEHLGWEDSSGVWWSNQTCYLDAWVTDYRSKDFAKYDDEEYDVQAWLKASKQSNISKWINKPVDGKIQCGACDYVSTEKEVADYENACYNCGYCFECDAIASWCDCYTPSQHKAAGLWVPEY